MDRDDEIASLDSSLSNSIQKIQLEPLESSKHTSFGALKLGCDRNSMEVVSMSKEHVVYSPQPSSICISTIKKPITKEKSGMQKAVDSSCVGEGNRDTDTIEESKSRNCSEDAGKGDLFGTQANVHVHTGDAQDDMRNVTLAATNIEEAKCDSGKATSAIRNVPEETKVSVFQSEQVKEQELEIENADADADADADGVLVTSTSDVIRQKALGRFRDPNQTVAVPTALEAASSDSMARNNVTTVSDNNRFSSRFDSAHFAKSSRMGDMGLLSMAGDGLDLPQKSSNNSMMSPAPQSVEMSRRSVKSSKEAKSSTEERWKLSLREKAWVSFVLMELLFSLNVWWVITSHQRSVYGLAEETVRREVRLMDTTYSAKINQMGFGFRGQSKNPTIVDYLKAHADAVSSYYSSPSSFFNDSSFLEGGAGGDAGAVRPETWKVEGYGAVKEVMANEVAARQIEYAAVLSKNRTILVSPNSDRTGQVFDPEGLVSLCLAHPEIGQIKTTAIVTIDELESEDPPIWRERQNALQVSAYTHPFDTKKDAVIRYTITPVFDLFNFEVDGKTPITYSTVNAFRGGSSAVIGYQTKTKKQEEEEEEEEEEEKEVRFWSASAMVAFDMVEEGVIEGGGGAQLDQEQPPSVIGYAATVNRIPTTLLKNIVLQQQQQQQQGGGGGGGGGGRVETQVADTGEYLIAAKPITQLTDLSAYTGSGSSISVSGVLVRSKRKGPDESGDVLNSGFGSGLILYGAVVVVLDALCIFGSIFLFIVPLEQLANRVLRKKKIKQRHMKSIQRRAYLIGVMIAVALTSVVPVVYFVVTFEQSALETIEEHSRSELSIASIMYQIKIDQMSFGFNGVSKNGAIRSLLEDPHSPKLQRLAQVALESEVSVRKIEYATLVDSSMNVVWSPNSNGDLLTFNATATANANAGSGSGNQSQRFTNNTGVVGSYFNPAGLARTVLESGFRQKVSAVLGWADLEREQAPVHTEQLHDSLPTSRLHPAETKLPSLVRLTGTPVYGPSSDGSGAPDGVLISGDIVNGKTAMNERVLDILELGYSGIFLYSEAGAGAEAEAEADTQAGGGVSECGRSGGYCLASSVYRPPGAGRDVSDYSKARVDVKLPAATLKALLDPIRRGNKQISTELGEVNGEAHAFSAMLVNQNQEVTSFGAREYPLSSNLAFFVRGKPLAAMEESLKNERDWNIVLITIQCLKVVLISLICMLAYRPLYKMLGTARIYTANTSSRANSYASKHCSPSTQRSVSHKSATVSKNSDDDDDEESGKRSIHASGCSISARRSTKRGK